MDCGRLYGNLRFKTRHWYFSFIVYLILNVISLAFMKKQFGECNKNIAYMWFMVLLIGNFALIVFNHFKPDVFQK